MNLKSRLSHLEKSSPQNVRPYQVAFHDEGTSPQQIEASNKAIVAAGKTPLNIRFVTAKHTSAHGD